MRGRASLQLGAMVLAMGAALASPMARAQTALWLGGGTDQDYLNPTNWAGGIVPDASGLFTVRLSFADQATILLNTGANVAGIKYLGASGFNGTQFQGTGSMEIGAGGISPGGGAGSTVTFDVPVTLSASQTWTAASGGDYGFIASNVGIGETGGARTLTIGDGQVYMSGVNTFTGGVIVTSTGTFYAGTDSAAGAVSGTLTLQDGATMKSWNFGATVANPVALGNNVVLGESSPGELLDLSGIVTAANASTTVNLAQASSVTLSGTLTGPSGTNYDFFGQGGPLQIVDGGSELIFSGAVSQVGSITADTSVVILAPTTVNPLTSFPGLSGGFRVAGQGYLGLDGTFTTPGAVATFFTTYGPGLASSIDGTIGFDNVEFPGVPNTFSDPVDLSGFLRASSFLGLGSATQAVLTGNITPTSDNFYVFGGGGGTLTVTSDLNGSGTELAMTHAPAPLTLILQGANNYTGGVLAQGGVLVFDSAVLPAAQQINLSGGYVGYTEVPALSSSAFIGLFNSGGAAQGVIGFDQHTPDPAMPRLIGDAVDLSVFNVDSSVFIGTATAAEFTTSAVITPANDNYQFTGVKGGMLTIDTQLTDNLMTLAANSVTLGLQNPIESNASVSRVNLTGNNTYTGGTTINSGAVFVNSSTAFGDAAGAIVIPDAVPTTPAPFLASYGGSPVTIANPISVGSMGGTTQGVTLGNASPVGGDMLVLNGVISDESIFNPGLIAISGPVTLAGMNTYSGGTIITGNGSAEALVTNSMSFGQPTGMINVQDDGVIAPLGADVTLANPITLNNSPLTLGLDADAFRLTLDGVISGTGQNVTIDSNVTLDAANTYSGATFINNANVIIGSLGSFGTGPVTLNNSSLSFGASNPMILDLSGTDPNSAVNLTTGQSLTLETDGTGGNFAGAITGDNTDHVVVAGGGIQQLSGNSTYAGGTVVSAGVLIAGSPNSVGSGAVFVSNGADLGVSNGTTLTVPINLAGNATLSGSGTFSPAAPLLFSAGNTVMPGNPISGQYISTLSFGSGVTFGTGGVFILNVADASGTAGVDYSTIDISGALTITAAPHSFTIAVNSVTPGAGPGPAIFNSSQPYSWTILSAGSIPVFNPTDFMISTTGFQNSLGGGGFAVGQSGNTLTLDFTPVPEPSTWMLMLTGLAAAGAALRRRRRS
jgi:autotransporter-associated beta strand protein